MIKRQMKLFFALMLVAGYGSIVVAINRDMAAEEQPYIVLDDLSNLFRADDEEIIKQKDQSLKPVLRAAGSSKIHYVVRKNDGDSNVIEFIKSSPLEAINEKNLIGQTPLHIAVALGMYKNVMYLLLHGAHDMVYDNRRKLPADLCPLTEEGEWLHNFFQMLDDEKMMCIRCNESVDL